MSTPSIIERTEMVGGKETDLWRISQKALSLLIFV